MKGCCLLFTDETYQGLRALYDRLVRQDGRTCAWRECRCSTFGEWLDCEVNGLVCSWESTWPRDFVDPDFCTEVEVSEQAFWTLQGISVAHGAQFSDVCGGFARQILGV